jgi:hypothetical protein
MHGEPKMFSSIDGSTEGHCPCVEHEKLGVGFHIGDRQGYLYVFFDSDLQDELPRARKLKADLRARYLRPPTQHSRICPERLDTRVYYDGRRREYLLSPVPLAREMEWRDLVAAVDSLRSNDHQLVSSHEIRSWCAEQDPPVSAWAAGETFGQEAFWNADESAAQVGGYPLLKFKESATNLGSTNYWAFRSEGRAARGEALDRSFVEVPWNSGARGKNGRMGKWEAKLSQPPDPTHEDRILTAEGPRRGPRMP